MRCRFGAGPGGIDGLALTMDDRGVDAILHVGRGIRAAKQARGVRVVLGEQQVGCALAGQDVAPEGRMLGDDAAW